MAVTTLSLVGSARYRIYRSSYGQYTYSKIESSVSFPISMAQEKYIERGYSDLVVLVYEIPQNINYRFKYTKYKRSAQIRIGTSGYHANFRIYTVDSDISKILQDTPEGPDYTSYYNGIPYQYPMNSTTGSGVGDSIWFEYPTEYIEISNQVFNARWGITTGKYIVVGIPEEKDTTKTIYSYSPSLETTDESFVLATPTFPVDVNIKNTINHIFTWERSYKYIYMPSADWERFNVPILSHKIQYRKKGTSGWTTLTVIDSNSYQNVPADTFDVDHYEYQILDYTYYDLLASTSELTEFNAIGQDAAPTISGVTNNSIPTVSWTDSNQAAFEIRIKDAEQNIVYTSGLIVGDNQSYQITKMLPNGTYIVEVRELNIYGIYSDWGSAQFVLNPSSVSAPTDIFVSVNNKFGVEISGTPVGSAQKTYVVRRVAGTDDIEIVGIYTGGIFTDYTAKGNTYYEYSLRNYNVAYADGAFIPVEVKVKEAIIQDGRDVTNFLDLSWSEDVTFNIEYTDEADRTLYNCLGRRYPVKEMGEWVNSVRSFVAYVRAEDINRLNDMNLNAPKVYFKGNHEYYACDMSIEDQGAYVGGGRMIRFTLTRIADDEGIII